ncbi:MAG: glycosyltransferase family 2 protein, partial [Alphaproteobacteria bacterium]
LYAEEPVSRPVSRETVERRTDFVIGACMFLSRNFLETIGLMDERYFLYFEEIDWSVRAGTRFPPVYAPKAMVYHKEGGSIGSSSQHGGRSAFSEFWLARSKLLFTRKFYPHLLPLIYLVSLAQIVRRLLNGQRDKARVILRACLGAKCPVRADRTKPGAPPRYQRAT